MVADFNFPSLRVVTESSDGVEMNSAVVNAGSLKDNNLVWLRPLSLLLVTFAIPFCRERGILANIEIKKCHRRVLSDINLNLSQTKPNTIFS